MFCCCNFRVGTNLSDIWIGSHIVLFSLTAQCDIYHRWHLPKYLSNYQVLRLLFCLLQLSDRTLNDRLYYFFFFCKILLCLGFFVSISFNITGPCNLCCFFDGTCHLRGFDVQAWLLPSLTSLSIYPSRAPTCLQLPLTLKINIRNLVLSTWSLRL